MSYGDFGDDHIRQYDRQQDKWVWRKLYLRRPYLRRPYLHIYGEGPADSHGNKWHFDHKLDLRETREINLVAGSFEGMFCIVPDSARRRPRTTRQRTRQHPDRADGQHSVIFLGEIVATVPEGSYLMRADTAAKAQEWVSRLNRVRAQEIPDVAEALAAVARRSFVAPRNVAEEDRLLVGKADYRGRPIIRELLVVNQRGEWQPARSLFEYVQQAVVEICAGWLEAHEEMKNDTKWLGYVTYEYDGSPPWHAYDRGWDSARSIYAKPLGFADSEYTPVETLLSCITPAYAASLWRELGLSLGGARMLHLVALRLRVPLEVTKQIESFVALPAKGNFPCRPDQIDRFMQGLKHAYESEAYENESRMGNANIESGHLGGAEIWRGDFRGWCIRRWYVFPQKLEQIFVTQRFRFNRDEVYDEEGLFGPVHVEGQPPHLLTFIFEGDDGEEDARTFECFVPSRDHGPQLAASRSHPWFVEMSRRAEECRREEDRRYREDEAAYRLRQRVLLGLEEAARTQLRDTGGVGTADSALVVAGGALVGLASWAVMSL